jgi:hypothetical protein
MSGGYKPAKTGVNGVINEFNKIKSRLNELERPNTLLPTLSGGSTVYGLAGYTNYVAGNYYHLTPTAKANISTTANTIYIHPIAITKTTTFTKFGSYVSTPGGSGTGYGAIYSANANGSPNAKIYGDFAFVNTANAGFQEITGQTITLSAGIYWLALVATGASPLAFTSASTSIFLPFIPAVTNSSTNILGYSATGFAGTLPATWTSTTTITSAPIVYLGL